MSIGSVIERLARAYLDKERYRLGIPQREQEAAAAEDSSLLRRAQATKMMRESESEPADRALRARLIEAQIDNLNEPNRLPPVTPPEKTGTWSVTDDGKHRINNLTGEVVPLGKSVGRPQTEPQDRSAWQPQYDAGGNLLGFVHQGKFHSREDLGVPAGARKPLASGTVSELALLDNPARLPELLRESLKKVRAGEAENPVAAGTGPIMGNLGNLYRKFDSSGAGGDFDSARKQVRQIVYGLSGKQLNESELKWLDSITPNLADPGVDEQINRLDAFVSALVQAKRQGISDPFTTARLGFGIQKSQGTSATPATVSPNVQRILDLLKARSAAGR